MDITQLLRDQEEGESALSFWSRMAIGHAQRADTHYRLENDGLVGLTYAVLALKEQIKCSGIADTITRTTHQQVGGPFGRSERVDL